MYLCWYSWRPPKKCFILHDLSKYNTCTLKFMFFSRLLEIVMKCIFYHSIVQSTLCKMEKPNLFMLRYHIWASCDKIALNLVYSFNVWVAPPS